MQRRSDLLRREGKRIGFVPTMGALHEGHLSLLRLAKKKSDVPVVSIFVNPTQFGPYEDFDRYPRDLEKDKRLLREERCEILFFPPVEEMYPKGFKSYVHVEELTEGLCGRFRPGHFQGVTTVVTKLFNIVKPHLAVFGQKDAQQAIVIQRMVKDLDFDIEILLAPTVREKDGLAMSSRNQNLSKREREKAALLYQSLERAREMIEGGEGKAKRVVVEMKKMISKNGIKNIDYVELVDPGNLKPVKTIRGRVLIALAVWVGKTRLIDNLLVNC